jgi:MoaA/NifB/PqqE/SkfB family radical SAM enzyme
VQYNPITNSFTGNANELSELPQVMWHITSQCNMNCLFCFNDKSVKNAGLYSRFSFSAIASILSSIGVQKVDISGGEPLLFNRLAEIVEACVDNNIFLTITTNGSGSIENIKWLTENWHKFSRIIVSIDGLAEEHDFLRQSRSAYKNAITLCRLLKSVGCNCLRINTVVTNQIIETTYAQRLCNEIINLHPIEWCLIQPFTLNKKATFEDVNISSREYEMFCAQCKKLLGNSDLQLLFRPNEIYSTYWTLTSDGKLVYGNGDFGISLIEDGIDSIKKAILSKNQIFPKE